MYITLHIFKQTSAKLKKKYSTKKLATKKKNHSLIFIFFNVYKLQKFYSKFTTKYN